MRNRPGARGQGTDDGARGRREGTDEFETVAERGSRIQRETRAANRPPLEPLTESERQEVAHINADNFDDEFASTETYLSNRDGWNSKRKTEELDKLKLFLRSMGETPTSDYYRQNRLQAERLLRGPPEVQPITPENLADRLPSVAEFNDPNSKWNRGRSHKHAKSDHLAVLKNELKKRAPLVKARLKYEDVLDQLKAWLGASNDDERAQVVKDSKGRLVKRRKSRAAAAASRDPDPDAAGPSNTTVQSPEPESPTTSRESPERTDDDNDDDETEDSIL